MNEQDLGSASFEVFRVMEIIRESINNWIRIVDQVKEFAADYENQDGDMKYARMLGLYEGVVSGLDYDFKELTDIVENGYSAAMFLSGENHE